MDYRLGTAWRETPGVSVVSEGTNKRPYLLPIAVCAIAHFVNALMAGAIVLYCCFVAWAVSTNFQGINDGNDIPANGLITVIATCLIGIPVIAVALWTARTMRHMRGHLQFAAARGIPLRDFLMPGEKHATGIITDSIRPEGRWGSRIHVRVRFTDVHGRERECWSDALGTVRDVPHVGSEVRIVYHPSRSDAGLRILSAEPSAAYGVPWGADGSGLRDAGRLASLVSRSPWALAYRDANSLDAGPELVRSTRRFGIDALIGVFIYGSLCYWLVAIVHVSNVTDLDAPQWARWACAVLLALCAISMVISILYGTAASRWARWRRRSRAWHPTNSGSAAHIDATVREIVPVPLFSHGLYVGEGCLVRLGVAPGSQDADAWGMCDIRQRNAIRRGAQAMPPFTVGETVRVSIVTAADGGQHDVMLVDCRRAGTLHARMPGTPMPGSGVWQEQLGANGTGDGVELADVMPLAISSSGKVQR